MVNYVPRGAGRKTATEKKNRHSQKTPLPPRKGVVEDAKTVIAAASQPALDTAGYPKAKKFRDELLAIGGWAIEIKKVGEDTTELTAHRGEETIFLVWDKASFVYGPSHHDYAGIRQQIRNASQGRQLAACSPEEASNEATKRRGAKRIGRKVETGENAVPVQRVLPFDVGTALDEEIIDALRGKEVAWHNRISGREEVAIVGVRGRETSKVEVVEQEKDGKQWRVVNFCCPTSGYRSFRVNDLTGVGAPGAFAAKRRLSEGGGEQEDAEI